MLGGQFMVSWRVSNRLGSQIDVPDTLPTARLADYSYCVGAAANDTDELASLAAEHGIKVAYENPCFAAHMPLP